MGSAGMGGDRRGWIEGNDFAALSVFDPLPGCYFNKKNSLLLASLRW